MKVAIAVDRAAAGGGTGGLPPTIVAPYDRRRSSARNVNNGDFVQPASGDPTQSVFSQGVGPDRATPLYVINRMDPVLFIVGVPEADADYVEKGNKARVRVPRSAARAFTAQVTRTSTGG